MTKQYLEWRKVGEGGRAWELSIVHDGKDRWAILNAEEPLEVRGAPEPSPPQALPCSCTTYCMHSGYPDAPIKRGVFCKEARASENRPAGTT